MLNTLTTVIARLIGVFRRPAKVTASPTQTVGLAHPGHTQIGGSPFSAPHTLHRHPLPQPALTRPLQKKEPAQPTTQEVKPGSESKTAPTPTVAQSTADGSKSKTRARRTPQRAKSQAKAGKKPAKRATSAKSPK